jgi:hypothetical protein
MGMHKKNLHATCSMPFLDHWSLESSFLVGYTLLHLLLGWCWCVNDGFIKEQSIIVGSWMGGPKNEGVILHGLRSLSYVLVIALLEIVPTNVNLNVFIWTKFGTWSKHRMFWLSICFLSYDSEARIIGR